MEDLQNSYRFADRLVTRGIETGNQAIESAKHMSDDIELTINALFVQSLAEKSEKSKSTNNKITALSSELLDSISVTSTATSKGKKFSEYMRKVKAKLKIKTKQCRRERILSDSIKSVTNASSYESRVKYLAAKMSDDRVLHINVILIDPETSRNEILPFEFNIRDKIPVKELMNKISQFAIDPILKNKKYKCLCLDNTFLLECHEPLQSYFLPSKQNQFAIAVPVGKTAKSIVELAMPIMHKTRRESITKGSGSSGQSQSQSGPTSPSLRESLNLSKGGKNDKNAMLPKLLHAAQCDSMQSTNTTTSTSNAATITKKGPPTEICIPNFVYMIMALLFIYVMHGSSNKKISCN